MKPPGKIFFLFILSFIIPAISILAAFAENNSVTEFVRVCSGSQSTIRNIYILDSNCYYFLADKIFIQTDTSWEKPDLPVAENISIFCPLANYKIRDFSFTDKDHGFVLCESAIFEIKNNLTEKIFNNDAPLKVNRLAALGNSDIWMIGESELILNVHNGILKKIESNRKENLRDIVVTIQRELWITGEKGLILYSGLKKFPPCPENNAGFAKHQIYEYGGHADDEYGVAMAFEMSNGGSYL